MSKLKRETEALILKINEEKKSIIEHKTKLWELVHELETICETVGDGCKEITDGLDLITRGMDEMSQYI